MEDEGVQRLGRLPKAPTTSPSTCPMVPSFVSTGPVWPGVVPQWSLSVFLAFLTYSVCSWPDLVSTALAASCPCLVGPYLDTELLIILISCSRGVRLPSAGIEIRRSGTIDWTFLPLSILLSPC